MTWWPATIAVVLVALPTGLFGLQVITEVHCGAWIPFVAPTAAVVWLASVVHEGRRGKKLVGWTAAFVGIAVAALVLHHGARAPQVLTGSYVRAWSQFHYYTGSKYFEELGYFDLYAATAVADADYRAAGGGPPHWGNAGKMRDLRTYRVEPVGRLIAGWSPTTMSDVRLAELGADTRFLRAQLDDDQSSRVVQDLGYNPAPPWTLLGQTVSRGIPPGSWAWPLLTSSDLWMQVVVILALLWGFGLRTAAIGTIWLHANPINQTLMLGGLFNYDWLAASVLGFAALHRGRPTLGGVAFAWAAMTRVFPGFLVLPLVWRVGGDVVRGRPQDRVRLQFVTTFVVACALLFAASHGTGRGAATWFEWKDKIALHTEHHATSSDRRIGLGRLVRHLPREGAFWSAARRRVEPAIQARLDARKAVGTVLGLLLLGLALRGRTDGEAMVLMLFAVWLLAVSSRYYGSIWVLALCLEHVRGRGSPMFAATWARGVLLAMIAVFYAWGSHGAQYLALNYEALALFVGLCGVYVLRRRSGDGESMPSPAPAGTQTTRPPVPLS